jgi:hypothetical protein
MDRFDTPALPPLYTGRSDFLKANRHMAQAMLLATSRCRIQSSEDIFDATGIKLWARDRPVEPALLSRLADRQLLKPIELCVTVLDPVSSLAMVDSLQGLAQQSPDFARWLAPQRADFCERLLGLNWNPQEQLLLSLLRFGPCDRIPHAMAVAVLAQDAGRCLGLAEPQLSGLLRAAMLHDLGLLYLPVPLTDAHADAVQQRHALLGSLAARELAGCDRYTTELIATSHERLNGDGYPRGLSGTGLTAPQRALFFAEAVSDLLCDPRRGAQSVAVACRLVPGEFDALLVGRAHSLARAGPAQAAPAAAAPAEVPVGLTLRHLHAELSRVIVVLSLLYGNEATVVARGDVWLSRLQPLMHALRGAGIEDALAHGHAIQPASTGEAQELSALHAEIVRRVLGLVRAIEGERSRSEALAASRTVAEVARLLKSACAGPGPALETLS